MDFRCFKTQINLILPLKINFNCRIIYYRSIHIKMVSINLYHGIGLRGRRVTLHLLFVDTNEESTYRASLLFYGQCLWPSPTVRALVVYAKNISYELLVLLVGIFHWTIRTLIYLFTNNTRGLFIGPSKRGISQCE